MQSTGETIKPDFKKVQEALGEEHIKLASYTKRWSRLMEKLKNHKQDAAQSTPISSPKKRQARREPSGSPTKKMRAVKEASVEGDENGSAGITSDAQLSE